MTQFKSPIKVFRSDNAPELSFTDFFKTQGVLHQFSCVERPQQNAVVERKHQHLLNVARALLFQSKLPIQFWIDCIMTAVYLINRTPTTLLQGHSLFHRLYHVQPDYTTLRVFGCLAFVSTLQAHRTKFQPRARTCIFLGYPPGIKGYRFYDLHTKQIFISRDAIFHEDIFPFHHVMPSATITDPFPHLVLPTPPTDHSVFDLPITTSSAASTTTNTSPADTTPYATAELSPVNPHSISPPVTDPSTSALPLARKSTRQHNPPSYLHDYHCHYTHNTPTIQPTTTLYPLCDHLSYQSVPATHRAFLMTISSTTEPTSYQEALSFPEWRLAMTEELDALENNNTWTVVSLPFNKHTVGCKWTYRIKYDSNGAIAHHKAR